MAPFSDGWRQNDQWHSDEAIGVSAIERLVSEGPTMSKLHALFNNGFSGSERQQVGPRYDDDNAGLRRFDHRYPTVGGEMLEQLVSEGFIKSKLHALLNNGFSGSERLEMEPRYEDRRHRRFDAGW